MASIASFVNSWAVLWSTVRSWTTPFAEMIPLKTTSPSIHWRRTSAGYFGSTLEIKTGGSIFPQFIFGSTRRMTG
jgi:hypothetical protein